AGGAAGPASPGGGGRPYLRADHPPVHEGGKTGHPEAISQNPLGDGRGKAEKEMGKIREGEIRVPGCEDGGPERLYGGMDRPTVSFGENPVFHLKSRKEKNVSRPCVGKRFLVELTGLEPVTSTLPV